jgi:copper chaperone CopZ
MKRFLPVAALVLTMAACTTPAPESTEATEAPVVQAAETITLSISGMDCDGCVKSVEEALKGVDGVAEVEVSLENHTAVIKGGSLDIMKLASAVDEAGYGATPFDPNAPVAPADTTKKHEHTEGHEHGEGH